jgi:hypothetical protein
MTTRDHGNPPKRHPELIARHALIAIRVLMGAMFVLCGFSAFFDALPRHATAAPGGALALGGALVMAGSALPLLKGVEVIVAALLELYQSLSAQASSAGTSLGAALDQDAHSHVRTAD